MPNAATVLILEDDLAILNGINDLLNYADIGYDLNILTATNGRHGLQHMRAQTPDLIVSDIMMPQMDGFEFLEALRENPAWVHIPLIFLTAKGKEEDILKGRLSGAELYVTKPFNSEHLLQYISSQLDRAFSRRAAHEQDLADLKRSILQMLSHEFKTPLTYVTAYYEILADSLTDFDDDEHLQTYLRGIQTGCLRLSRLIEDLILIITLRTDEARAQFTANARPLPDLGRLLQAVGETYAAEAAQHNITIDYEITPDMGPVLGHESQLRDVLDRIVANALKFTRRKQIMDPDSAPGHVSLRGYERDGAIQLAIEDNGVGFPPQLSRKIFGFMFQHNRELMEQQGSGSGLAIAKGLVDIHGGDIQVSSEEGVGATFVVRLPALSAATDAQAVTSTDTMTTAQKRAVVLIVEDDVFLLNGLQELLELSTDNYHFDVLTATNGLEGLAQLEQREPDIIVSDIMMPYMDGFKFLDAVRTNPEWLQIPFIFLTAKGEARDVRKGRTSGAEEYVTKPYDSDQLIDFIIARLNRHFQVQDLRTQDFELLKRDILNLLQPEFREPITAVNTYSQQMANALSTAKTDQDLQQSLFGIQESSQELVRLVEDFIILAELKTGEAQASYQKRVYPMRNIGVSLMEAAQLVSADMAEADIVVRAGTIPALPAVVSDTELLLTIFNRLLMVTKQLCHQSHGREILISVEVTDIAVKIEMAFHALPLAPETASLITSFCNGDGDVDILPRDIGPQLAIVRGLMALHEGQVTFSDQTEPAGYHFCLTFPIHAG